MNDLAKVPGGDRVRIYFIVDRYHVSTPDEVIEDDIRQRLSHVKGRAVVEAAVAHAIRRHHENRDLFLKVQRGF